MSFSTGRGLRFAAIAGLLALAAFAPATAHAGVGFGPKQFIDHGLAGGEPLVFADSKHGTLIYTSHEGTTHLYRNGFTTTVPDWFTQYRNQVNEWYSEDDGKTWKRVDWNGTGFFQNPAQNSGFSDPDLTQDDGGRVYNTGINLATDAIFSTNDGGRTWDLGTIQCHQGDRPWLAGGKPDEVFMATNATQGGHIIMQSTDGGNSCGAQYSSPGGNGKLYYLREGDGVLVEPTSSLALNVWHRGDAAFTHQTAVPEKPAGGMTAHWSALAVDANNTIYEVWDDNPRARSGFSCGDTAVGNANPGAPLPNHVKYAYTTDLGKTWSKPVTLAAPDQARAFWPWAVAGDAGKLSVTWYQSDSLVDLDCQASSIRVWESTIQSADTATPQVDTTVVSSKPIHSGGVCQGGTTCLATGQDRRLGDFFTNSIDQNGCVMIATGDTTTVDPVFATPQPYSLPVIFRQNAGPPLKGSGDCSDPAGIVPSG
jgi:hypothetical protein